MPTSKVASKVVGIDHISIRVSDYEKSKDFYGKLFEHLGFEISDEYPNTIGWTNGRTRYWIAPAEGRKTQRIGDVGLHHYAFELRSRRDVDALQGFLEGHGVRIVDPAAEYYEDYYAVFFLDPDGIKLEGMKYGEKKSQAAQRRKAPKTSSRKAPKTSSRKAPKTSSRTARKGK